VEGRDVADAIGDRFTSRQCRCWGLAWRNLMQGDLAAAVAQSREIVAEAEADGDTFGKLLALSAQVHALAYQGNTSTARAAAESAIEAASGLGDVTVALAYCMLGVAALAAGDVGAANDANHAACQGMTPDLGIAKVVLWRRAETALATGELSVAEHWSGQAVSSSNGWHRAMSLATRARVKGRTG
jgi:hypothetical protein